MKKKLKATSLRIMLAMTVFITVCGIGGGFYFAYQWLDQYATDVYSKAPKIFSGDNEDDAAKQLQTQIERYQAISNKASDMFISDQNYQNLIMNDLIKYSQANSISITGFNQTDSQTANDAASIPGVTAKHFTMTVNSPVNYEDFIKFLKCIETNLPVIIVTDLDISRVSNSSEKVTVKPIGIEVYTKQ